MAVVERSAADEGLVSCHVEKFQQSAAEPKLIAVGIAVDRLPGTPFAIEQEIAGSIRLAP